jgi:hypothetical protein
MISTYFGSMTIVLKLPLTRAASTKGLQRYKGLLGVDAAGEGGNGGVVASGGGNVAEVGVGDLLLGPRGWRDMERLEKKSDLSPFMETLRSGSAVTYPIELRKDMAKLEA